MPSLFYGAPHVDDAWAGVARLAAARERDQGHPLDAARAEIARLTSERDEARRALELTRYRNGMVAARAERDQARLELEATRAEVAKLTAPEALAEAYITTKHGPRMWGHMDQAGKDHFTEQAEDRATTEQINDYSAGECAAPAAECAAPAAECAAPKAPTDDLVWVDRGWCGEVMIHPWGPWAELESWGWTVHSPRDPVPSMRMVKGYITGRPPGSIECARRNAKSALLQAAYRLERARACEGLS